MSTKSVQLAPGAAATLACLYEATAPKPGNVHPCASFDDAAYADFVRSAVAVGPILGRAAIAGIGKTVLDAVRASRQACGTNTNLGTLLLLAPMATVPVKQSIKEGISGVLNVLTDEDTKCVYEAIRLSAAGGLGRVEQADVFSDAPALSLVEAMRLAADRDLIARQFVNSFADVFDGTAAWIAEGLGSGLPLSASIVHTHLRQMAAAPDSLIQRKCGRTVAHESSQRASQVLSAGMPGEQAYQNAIADFDTWLRADGHRRNPGTTADLIAAGLFVLLREGRLDWQTW
jgi:triphosphoribosyl-dephospho-CoA synthase